MRKGCAKRVRLCLVVLGMVLPVVAGAECFRSPDRLPSRVSFVNGSVVEILERGEGRLRYRSVMADGTVVEENTLGGLLPLGGKVGAQTHAYDWTGGMPDLAGLAPGDVRSALGVMRMSAGPPVAISEEIRVEAAEVISLSGCDYPVLRILSLRWRDGVAAERVTRWLHVGFMIPLRTVVEFPARDNLPARTVEFRVAAFE